MIRRSLEISIARNMERRLREALVVRAIDLVMPISRTASTPTAKTSSLCYTASAPASSLNQLATAKPHGRSAGGR